MKRVQGVALALIVVMALAVVFAPVPGATRWIRTLHNSAHGPIFGCVALLTLWVLRSRSQARGGAAPLSAAWIRDYLIALAVAVLLGGITELAQIPTGRDATWSDAFNDVLGALAFLALVAVFDARVRVASGSRAMRAAAAVVAMALLAVLAWPVTRAALEYRERERKFPVIADFSRTYDRYFIHQESAEISPARLPEQWATSSGEAAMHVRLLEGPYPGLHFIELVPDWRGHAALALDVTNPTSTDLQLVLRVHDAHHNNQLDDRFNKVVQVRARSREVIRVPLEEIAAGPTARALDLQHVAGIILFSGDSSGTPGELYLSRVWLTE